MHPTQILEINRRSETERASGEDSTTQCHKAEFIDEEEEEGEEEGGGGGHHLESN
jgi:hypothetical protein